MVLAKRLCCRGRDGLNAPPFDTLSTRFPHRPSGMKQARGASCACYGRGKPTTVPLVETRPFFRGRGCSSEMDKTSTGLPVMALKPCYGDPSSSSAGDSLREDVSSFRLLSFAELRKVNKIFTSGKTLRFAQHRIPSRRLGTFGLGCRDTVPRRGFAACLILTLRAH